MWPRSSDGRALKFFGRVRVRFLVGTLFFHIFQCFSATCKNYRNCVIWMEILQPLKNFNFLVSTGSNPGLREFFDFLHFFFDFFCNEMLPCFSVITRVLTNTLIVGT